MKHIFYIKKMVLFNMVWEDHLLKAIFQMVYHMVRRAGSIPSPLYAMLLG